MQEPKKQIYMKDAFRQAQRAFECNQVPVGCVFVEYNADKEIYQIVKRAHNLTNKLKNATEHSQIICIKQLEKEGKFQEIKSLYLFVTVEPCIMCAKALQITGIKKVFFGQYNDRFGGTGSVLKMNTYPVEGGYMQKESMQLLKQFYQKGNQKLPSQLRNKKRIKKT